MKKLIITIISMLWIACYGIQAQTGKIRYLQAQESDKVTRIITDGATPFSIRTEMNENNQLMVMVYKGDEVVAMYPEGTKFYPKYENPDETSVRGLVEISENESFGMGSNVIFVKEDMNSKIISLDDNGDLLVQNDAVLDGIKVGDILYSLPTADFPDGYAIKVVAIENPSLRAGADEYMCKTEPATIEEVFPDGYMCVGEEYLIKADAENTTVFYDIDEQTSTGNLINLLDAVDGSPFDLLNDFSISYKQKMDGWSKYQIGQPSFWQRASIKVTNKETTISYILFDLDNNYSTTYDQILLNFTVEHDLSNTYIIVDPSTLSFAMGGYHTWGVNASLSWQYKNNWSVEDSKKAEYYLKEKALGKKFCIASIPLTPASLTNLFVKPSLDVFFELKVDLEGNFYVEAGIKEFMYNFNFSAIREGIGWDVSKPVFKMMKKGTPYFDVQANAKATLRASVGGGLTFEIPAFRATDVGNKKSYAGIYFDYGADLTLKLAAGIRGEAGGNAAEFEGLCLEADISYEAYPEFYGEYDINFTRFIHYKNKIPFLGKEDFEPSLKGHLWNDKWCMNEATTVVSLPAQNITDHSATLSGEITAEIQSLLDNDGMKDKGFFYSDDLSLLVDDEYATQVSLGKGLASFFANIDNLQPNTTYYFVAYADWILGREYSDVYWFTTTLPALNIYTITASVDGVGGSIAPSGTLIFNEGDNLLLSITPDDGYIIDQVLIDGVNYPDAVTSGKYVFANIDADHTITASFKKNNTGNNDEEGVVINGVRWATRNVDAPGTFAAKPEDPGMFYQWNRNIGWSATDPMVNSNGGTAWDSSTPAGDTWEKANDPSPAGWRVPTLEEAQKLLDTEKVSHVLTTENGINGGRFTDKTTGNSLFLPATLDYVNFTGGYWSSTQNNSYYAFNFYFYSGGASWGYSARRDGCSVRSVAEN